MINSDHKHNIAYICRLSSIILYKILYLNMPSRQNKGVVFDYLLKLLKFVLYSLRNKIILSCFKVFLDALDLIKTIKKKDDLGSISTPH